MLIAIIGGAVRDRDCNVDECFPHNGLREIKDRSSQVQRRKRDVRTSTIYPRLMQRNSRKTSCRKRNVLTGAEATLHAI